MRKLRGSLYEADLLRLFVKGQICQRLSSEIVFQKQLRNTSLSTDRAYFRNKGLFCRRKKGSFIQLRTVFVAIEGHHELQQTLQINLRVSRGYCKHPSGHLKGRAAMKILQFSHLQILENCISHVLTNVQGMYSRTKITSQF